MDPMEMIISDLKNELKELRNESMQLNIAISELRSELHTQNLVQDEAQRQWDCLYTEVKALRQKLDAKNGNGRTELMLRIILFLTVIVAGLLGLSRFLPQ